MKVKTIDLYRRIITVSDNIVSYFIFNPTELRYERCKKILDRLKEVSEELPDNEYKHDNWLMLMTALDILTNIGINIYDAEIKKLDGPTHRNRKISITCSSSLFKRLRSAK